MKFVIYSDLHCEFSYFDMPEPDDPETVLILLGDIFVGDRVLREGYLPKWSSMYKQVFFVLGNHDYYKNNITYLVSKLRNKLTNTNVTILDNDVVMYENVQLVGGTFWTNFNNGDPMASMLAGMRMNDFRQIRISPSYKKFSPRDAIVEHLKMRSTLDNVDFSIPTLVLTHHAPSSIFIDFDRYGSSADLNYAYYTNMESFILEKQPLMWAAGHTHKRVEDYLGDTLLYSNPRGYISNTFNEGVGDFQLNEVWEVKEGKLCKL